MPAYLVVRTNENRLQTHALTGDRMVIGRSREAEISLPWDEGVSRVHARLECIAGEWLIFDNGISRNGTFVNRHRIASKRLAHEDVICVGSTLLAFKDPRGVIPPTPPLLKRPAITPAERRVLEGLCRPLLVEDRSYPATNKEIADYLTLGLPAVKTHLRHLYKKYGIRQEQNRKRAELARQACDLGEITRDDYED